MNNSIIKTELIKWDTLELFQPSNLKKMSEAQLNKLKTSLKNNGLKTPFYVWENKDKIYCLDGHHRIPALKILRDEGVKVPDKLPANFIHCKNKKDAKKAVLIYNSHYADIIKSNLDDWVVDLNLEELENEIDLSDIDFAIKADSVEPEYEITKELYESHNYVVLYFDNDIDWMSAKEKLGIKKVGRVQRQTGEPIKNIGEGKVLKGVDVIERIV